MTVVLQYVVTPRRDFSTVAIRMFSFRTRKHAIIVIFDQILRKNGRPLPSPLPTPPPDKSYYRRQTCAYVAPKNRRTSRVTFYTKGSLHIAKINDYESCSGNVFNGRLHGEYQSSNRTVTMTSLSPAAASPGACSDLDLYEKTNTRLTVLVRRFGNQIDETRVVLSVAGP